MAFRLLFGERVEKVEIEFDRQRYGRVAHPVIDEAAIEAAWSAARSANPRIFNGSKFRLGGVSTEAGRVRLRLGVTDYRDYLGTNRATLAARLAADGERDLAFSGAYLSNALGCETVLVTRDEKVLLLRRSSAVATHGGEFNGPSGHAEPDRCDLDDADSVAREVLRESIVAEIVEETGIPRSHLGSPRLIGAMVETSTLKPDLLFLTDTDLDSADVADAYRTALENWESDNIIFLTLPQLRDRRHLATIPLTAVTQAALLCYLQELDSSDAT